MNNVSTAAVKKEKGSIISVRTMCVIALAISSRLL